MCILTVMFCLASMGPLSVTVLPFEADQVAPEGGESAEEFLNETQLARVESFLDLVQHPGIHFLSPRRVLGGDGLVERTFSFTFDSESRCDYVTMTYDLLTDLVTDYSREATVEDCCDGQTAEVFSKVDAFELTKPVLKYYGLSTRMEEYVLSRFDTECVLEDSWQKLWILHRDFEFKGVPCRRSFVRVTISPRRRIVRGVCYRPVVVPEDVEDAISKDEARERAMIYLRDSPRIRLNVQRYEMQPTDRVRGVIARPNSSRYVYDGIGEDISGRFDFGKAYHCWEVRVDMWNNVDGAKSTAVLWIAMESGDLIGADFDRWSEESKGD